MSRAKKKLNSVVQKKVEPWTTFSFSVVGIIFLFGIVVPLIDSDGITGEFHKKKPGTLHVDSVPRNASVYVNNNLVGVTPVKVGDLRGSYSVKIAKIGYNDINTIAFIGPRKTVNIKVNLIPKTDSTTTRNLKKTR